MLNRGPYICIQCGREFPRKFSALRHLGTVERGIGQIIPKADYVPGILSRTISPRRPNPTYRGRVRPTTTLVMESFAKKFFERMADDAWLDPQKRSLVMNALMMFSSLQSRDARPEECASFDRQVEQLMMILSMIKK